ncbi:helix-turn-helix domain-containing protein [Microvirga calopogonii]|uniref:helix-turn-helix domain-containing protein n=1 Tax=Microvirga calopogonii TaxID=2078013 RepID=UPI003CCA7548
MGRVSRPQQAAIAEQGIGEGRWTRDQVAAFFELPDREASPKQRRPRTPAVTRRKRLSRRRCSFSRYVRRFSIDVLVHPGLSTGAVTTLVYLISRCGRYKQFQTCTSWLAADLGVSPRTIQNHYRQLEQAGFLVRSSPDRLGRTTIYLTNLVEARPAQKEQAQRVAQHGEGAKICSPTNETDSKERRISHTQRESPNCEAPWLSELQRMSEAKRAPIRATSAVVSHKSARKRHPPDSSFEASNPRVWLTEPYRWTGSKTPSPRGRGRPRLGAVEAPAQEIGSQLD